MRKIALSAMIALFSAVSASATPQLVYLNCVVPSEGGGQPPSHFTFTLDRQNSTVSYYVEETHATNKENAVFGPKTITWVFVSGVITLTRTINRVNLSFTQELDSYRTVGQCSVVRAPHRKF